MAAYSSNEARETCKSLTVNVAVFSCFFFSKTDEDSQLQIRFVITLLERDFHERLKSAG